MSTHNSARGLFPLMSVALVTLAALSASCGADSAQTNPIAAPNVPWSTSLTGVGPPTGSGAAPVASDSFTVPSTYKTSSGQVVSTGHLVIEYVSQVCANNGGAGSILINIDSGPSATALKGAMIFTGVASNDSNTSSLTKVYLSADDAFHLQWSGAGTCTFVLFGQLMPN